MRGSGRSETFALMSEVPPSPHPTTAFISALTFTSNIPVAEPRWPAGVSSWTSAVADASVSGYSPGCRSLPRSSTHTCCPARARRDAVIAPP